MKQLKQLLIAFSLLISSLVKADEGMWLPLLLGKMNEAQMKSLGMKISAKDIYDINNGSLKDAIVSLGGFCTGAAPQQCAMETTPRLISGLLCATAGISPLAELMEIISPSAILS